VYKTFTQNGQPPSGHGYPLPMLFSNIYLPIHRSYSFKSGFESSTNMTIENCSKYILKK